MTSQIWNFLKKSFSLLQFTQTFNETEYNYAIELIHSAWNICPQKALCGRFRFWSLTTSSTICVNPWAPNVIHWEQCIIHNCTMAVPFIPKSFKHGFDQCSLSYSSHLLLHFIVSVPSVLRIFMRHTSNSVMPSAINKVQFSRFLLHASD